MISENWARTSHRMAWPMFNSIFSIILPLSPWISLNFHCICTGMVDGTSMLNGDASITCVRLLVRFHQNSISFVDFLIKILFFSLRHFATAFEANIHSSIKIQSILCVCVSFLFFELFFRAANQFIRTVSIIFSIYDSTLQIIQMEWSSRFCL